jgi:crossover junction endodeoxyribonuclease RuvC
MSRARFSDRLTVKILGVDRGIHGGLAIVIFSDDAAPELVAATDIPIYGAKAKERVDVAALRSWIEPHHPYHALIERAQSIPNQGASSGFKYGRAVGAIEATVAACGIPLTILEPRVWKQFHHLRGDNKELSRQRVLQLFPKCACTIHAQKRSWPTGSRADRADRSRSQCPACAGNVPDVHPVNQMKLG